MSTLPKIETFDDLPLSKQLYSYIQSCVGCGFTASQWLDSLGEEELYAVGASASDFCKRKDYSRIETADILLLVKMLISYEDGEKAFVMLGEEKALTLMESLGYLVMLKELCRFGCLEDTRSYRLLDYHHWRTGVRFLTSVMGATWGVQ